MADTELRPRDDVAPNAPVADRLGTPAAASRRRSRIRLLPLVITLIAVAAAVALGQAMWNVYVGMPWTRDGTVRVYVVTMAPQVAGQIVQLPVADNQFVHSGDLLMVIDPTNYKIAVDLAEAAVETGASYRAQRAARGAASPGADPIVGDQGGKADL